MTLRLAGRKRAGPALGTGAEGKRMNRERSPHLVVIKKGNHKDLSLLEHRDLIKNMDDQISSGRYEREPKIDWASWKDKSMIGCQDQFTVCWIKGIVPKLMPGYRAWGSNEVPFYARYITTVRLPTGSRPAEKIVERVIAGNGLELREDSEY